MISNICIHLITTSLDCSVEPQLVEFLPLPPPPPPPHQVWFPSCCFPGTGKY